MSLRVTVATVKVLQSPPKSRSVQRRLRTLEDFGRHRYKRRLTVAVPAIGWGAQGHLSCVASVLDPRHGGVGKRSRFLPAHLATGFGCAIIGTGHPLARESCRHGLARSCPFHLPQAG